MSPKPTVVPILEVGGTHVTAAVVDTASWSVDQVSRLSLDGHAPAEALLDRLAEAAGLLTCDRGAQWGVAMPGPFDYDSGIGRFTGVGKFDSLNGVDVRAGLSSRLGARAGGVSFINDASAFLVGEWRTGAAAGTARSAAVTLGTGIGSAFLADGTIVDTGPEVPPEGEAHLLSHQGRPLEDWVSRRALMRAYAGEGDVSPQLDVREIADLARQGEARAGEVFRSAFTVLGTVLGPWLARFGAEVIVVGGSIARAWDLIEQPLHAGLAATGDLRVRRAVDADRSALVGAAHPAVVAAR